MDKKKTEFAIVGFLIVVFVFLALSRIIGGRPAVKGAAPSDTKISLGGEYDMASIPGQVVGSAQASAKGQTRRPRTKDLSKTNASLKTALWGRDPFVLKEMGSGSVLSGLKIMGITAAAGANKKSMAIINDEIVSVGSKVGQYEVVQIMKDRVTITDGKDNFDLLLEQ